MGLQANALTDYATVADELGITSPTDQAKIERAINAVSAAIEQYCNRKLTYLANITEKKAMYGDCRLLLDRYPVSVLGSAETSMGDVDPTEVRIYDADAGIIWNDRGWPWSAYLRPGVTQLTLERELGTENKLATVVYAGGYITGPQAYGTQPAWPGAAQSVVPGRLISPSGQPTQLWQAAPTTLNVDGVTGSSEPTWGSSPTQGDTVTDGTVTWTYLGTRGSAGSLGTAVTLPADLERACLIGVKAMYLERLENPNVKSESLLGASYTYTDQRGGLPRPVLDLIGRYVRAVSP